MDPSSTLTFQNTHTSACIKKQYAGGFTGAAHAGARAIYSRRLFVFLTWESTVAAMFSFIFQGHRSTASAGIPKATRRRRVEYSSIEVHEREEQTRNCVLLEAKKQLL